MKTRRTYTLSTEAIAERKAETLAAISLCNELALSLSKRPVKEDESWPFYNEVQAQITNLRLSMHRRWYTNEGLLIN
jgi:hypothetical protein